MQKAPWEEEFVQQVPQYTNITPWVLSDLDLRVKAVESATRLYADKPVANLGDYNEKFEKLINLIYKFYKDGSNKELH